MDLLENFKLYSDSVPARNGDINFTDNALKILERRFLRKNSSGVVVETPEQMFERLASVVAAPDEPYADVKKTTNEFYNLLSTKDFFPNSPTFTGAGTPLGQLAACFVLPIADDLGKEDDGIFSTLRNAALIQQSGGGNGFSFSRLRPSGSRVASSNGKATGPIGFMRVYDHAFGEVAQGGVRRGANMGVLRVDHPDIRDFIKCKSAEGDISNFNISVAITDAFMQAVKEDTTYDLIDPHTKEVAESPKAREIFDMIVKYAYRNGEPGILYIDEANRDNPVPHLYKLEATNPCGEQWLGPYENCCLGSINLSHHVTESGKMDWEKLAETTKLATRFLDNVVTANKYVPAVPQLRESAMRARRIGLGLMGLADVFYKLRVSYGSSESLELAAKIAEFIRYNSMKTSIALAQERGAFPAINGSIYDPENITWEAPTPLFEYEKDFGRPELNWETLKDGIKKHGIRNAAQMTIAPTGTRATVAGLEGYGCEPVFALAYKRNVYQAAGEDEKLTLNYVSPLFQEALDEMNMSEERRDALVEEIVTTGSCQKVVNLPDEIKSTFVVSSDISPEKHILMQAALQRFIDNSISKTCNLPASAEPSHIADLYMRGWELGLKGLTVYVAGQREEEVLETKETSDAKKAKEETPVVLERGHRLTGHTYKVKTPQGNAYIVINRNGNDEPFEVFVNVGKAGTDVAALSEALGRLISGWLRSSEAPKETVKEIVVQLIGIGGATSVGFGKDRVGSIPDAVAKILSEDLGIQVRANGTTIVEEDKDEVSVFSYANVCPDCGNATFVREEGCTKCYTCGYSVC
ncbi:adenosylcobalamin-dependent ribonucleoside-diphosphate reductase [candidate division WWE3 bacterium]|nr:adenosylcobalamin-dependent ribonucleoside-diphosphate reductase [candidate division WWE3 bacterium]